MAQVKKAEKPTDGDETRACIGPAKGIIGGVSVLVYSILSDVSDFVGSIPDVRVRGTGSRKCPFCAEHIKKQAIKCRYCGSDLVEEKQMPAVPLTGADEFKSR
jgi:hypothetical protein